MPKSNLRQFEYAPMLSSFACGPGPRRRQAPKAKAEGKDAERMRQLSPIVTVFGAGIAGLSAAHELIERGFSVQVVEPSRSPDEETAAEVGGLARNQFGRVPANPELLHASKKHDPKFRDNIETVLRRRFCEMRAVQRRFPVPWRIQFAGDSVALNPDLRDDWDIRNEVKLQAVWEALKEAHRSYLKDAAIVSDPKDPLYLPADWDAREVLYVEVRGHAADTGTEADNRQASRQRADAVREWLLTANTRDGSPLIGGGEHLISVDVGSAEPIGDPQKEEDRARSNRVEIRIVEDLMPGEHGYRFFPAFYRHLFDTMRRTPILDARGHATGQTAYDRLVPTPDLGLALGDNRPAAALETRRVRSLEELRRLSELFFKRLGVTHRDMARFQVRLLKFLTSSPERRCREYESQSWWTFIGGEGPKGYSEPMRRYLMETSQALVAMNAEETDARSQGNIVSQLQLHYLQDGSDFTLNGPTSDVWLRAWKRYLQRQGVRFFVGELVRLRWDGHDKESAVELRPVTGDTIGWLQTPPRGRNLPIPPKDVPDIGVVARVERESLVIDVLDADDGDYVVEVLGRSYCFSARSSTDVLIAHGLAAELNEDPHVSAHAFGAAIHIRGRLTATLEDLGKHNVFADRGALGERIRSLPRKAFDRVQPKFAEGFLARLEAHHASLIEQGKKPQDVHVDIDDLEWAYAGVLRAKDDAFDQALGELEQRLGCELVPHIRKEGSQITLAPAAWVRELLAKPDDDITDTATLCPYHFRIGTVVEAAAGDADAQDPQLPQYEWPSSIWVRVSNPHQNLRVISDPVSEDPFVEYFSHRTCPPPFRPDFYVLALPYTEASRLVWRADRDRPGLLHGCLSEILDFDRRASRRTPDGVLVQPVRDAHGRPDAEYPLRDFAGVQYYFQNQVRIGKGHIYFPGAQWGLSSISQLAYWRERMSPAGPFIGQLSVDIGNFYNPAAPRSGNRYGRSGWHSTAQEIADEVWFQVRQGLDRERAGVLLNPAYYHIDEGLTFLGTLGSAFRATARIGVAPDTTSHSCTVWIHGEPFSRTGRDAQTIALGLAEDIGRGAVGAVTARVLPIPPEKRPHESGVTPPEYELRIQSTIPEGAALIIVTGAKPGRFEVTIAGRTHTYVHPSVGHRDRSIIRDSLFQVLAADTGLPVTFEQRGYTGIALLPARNGQLPPIAVHNDDHQLDVVHGTMLHVRIEQCAQRLSFLEREVATIGYNTTPFLINVPGQWSSRPGIFTPSQLTFEDKVLRPGREERVSYRISNKRWVAAGTYMATTTQLTTMESANESARHAVNAILRCLAFRQGDDYNSQGRVFADLADIWDPEQNELTDLEPLKRLDRKLCNEGLPHVLDILKIIEYVDAMPMHGTPSRDPMANVLHLFQHIADGSDHNWSFLKQSLGDLLGQAVERGNDMVDPFGVLRELRHGTSAVTDKIRDFLMSVMTGQAPGNPPKP